MKSSSTVIARLKNSKKQKVVLFSCLLLILTPVPFLPSLNNDFVNWDDGVYIRENSWIKDLNRENIREMFTKTFTTGEYVPLCHLSYALDYWFSGLDPGAYHRTNLILHALNTVLVFCFVVLLGGDVYSSLVCAILFGIHPLRVESVAWASERKDTLYTLFFVMSLIFYLYYKMREKRYFYFLSISMFVLSLLSKQTAIILPVILILCDYVRSDRIDKRSLLMKIPYFTLSIALGLFLIYPTATRVSIYQGHRFATRLMAVLTSPAFYLENTIIPLRLSAFYPYPDKMDILQREFFFPAILSLYLCFTSFYFRRHTRKFLFGTLFYMFGIVPMLIGLPFSGSVFAADRYTYLASIGIFYMAGEGFSWLYRRKLRERRTGKALLLIIFTAIAAMLSLLTWERCKVWKNNISLWQDVLRTYPDVPEAHVNLSSTYTNLGQIDKAMQHARAAIELRPRSPRAQGNLGTIYLELRQPENAIPYFLRALEANPKSVKSHHNLGISYSMLGDFEKAIESYEKAVELEPLLAEAYDGLGLIYLHLGEPEKAVRYFERAIEVKPDFIEARRHLEKANSEVLKEMK